MKKLDFNVSCLISAGDAEFVSKIGSFGHEVNTQRIQADLSIEVAQNSEVIKTISCPVCNNKLEMQIRSINDVKKRSKKIPFLYIIFATSLPLHSLYLDNFLCFFAAIFVAFLINPILLWFCINNKPLVFSSFLKKISGTGIIKRGMVTIPEHEFTQKEPFPISEKYFKMLSVCSILFYLFIILICTMIFLTHSLKYLLLWKLITGFYFMGISFFFCRNYYKKFKDSFYKS